MAERTLRGRLSNRSGSKPMIDVVATGIVWEGARAVWFAKAGQTAVSDDCLVRQQRLEQLLVQIHGEA